MSAWCPQEVARLQTPMSMESLSSQSQSRVSTANKNLLAQVGRVYVSKEAWKRMEPIQAREIFLKVILRDEWDLLITLSNLWRASLLYGNQFYVGVAEQLAEKQNLFANLTKPKQAAMLRSAAAGQPPLEAVARQWIELNDIPEEMITSIYFSLRHMADKEGMIVHDSVLQDATTRYLGLSDIAASVV